MDAGESWDRAGTSVKATSGKIWEAWTSPTTRQTSSERMGLVGEDLPPPNSFLNPLPSPGLRIQTQKSCLFQNFRLGLGMGG